MSIEEDSAGPLIQFQRRQRTDALGRCIGLYRSLSSANMRKRAHDHHGRGGAQNHSRCALSRPQRTHAHGPTAHALSLYRIFSELRASKKGLQVEGALSGASWMTRIGCLTRFRLS
jgi:hypothetical protein